MTARTAHHGSPLPRITTMCDTNQVHRATQFLSCCGCCAWNIPEAKGDGVLEKRPTQPSSLRCSKRHNRPSAEVPKRVPGSRPSAPGVRVEKITSFLTGNGFGNKMESKSKKIFGKN